MIQIITIDTIILLLLIGFIFVWEKKRFYKQGYNDGFKEGKKLKFEDIDWSKEDTGRYEDIRDIIDCAVRRGECYESAAKIDKEWLLEIVKRAQK